MNRINVIMLLKLNFWIRQSKNQTTCLHQHLDNTPIMQFNINTHPNQYGGHWQVRHDAL